MPIVVSEKVNSRQSTKIDGATGDDRKFVYIATGSDDVDAITTAVLAVAPATIGPLVRRTFPATEIAPSVWEVEAQYVTPNSRNTPPATSDDASTFEISSETQRITQALSTSADYAPSGVTPPDFMGSINVTADGVEGVDIIVPQYSFTETRYMEDADVTSGFKAVVFSRSGKVNSDTFRGFAAGEVRFDGVSGSRRGRAATDLWEITYRFTCSPNATGLIIGAITGINKMGWEYLWVRYEDFEDTDAKRVVKRAASAHVVQVYPTITFAELPL